MTGVGTQPLSMALSGHDAEVEALYLDVGPRDQAFAAYHRPSSGARDCAIVVCPPFGWEEISSHRSLRSWARVLADAGYPVLRLTYPGMGDSPGDARDPARLQTWGDSVAAAAGWLRDSAHAGSVVAIGIGFGGLVAYSAVANGAPVDGLVLWSAPTRGRELLRQLRAFSRLENSEAFAGLPSSPPLPDEREVEAGGFLLSAGSVAALEALDLSALTLPHGLPLGALLLRRDGMKLNQTFELALIKQNVEVSTDGGGGYAAMTSHPQDSVLPHDVVTCVSAWLKQATERTEPIPWSDEPVTAHRQTTIEFDGATVTERPVKIVAGPAHLAGVLTQPNRDPTSVCALFLNAGAIPRVGPNRMWVESARRWGARGVPSLRLDVEGIGEAGGGDQMYQRTERLHETKLVEQVRSALDFLQAEGVAERFLLIGMCSGAFWALHALLADPRVVSAQFLNLTVIIWDERLAPSRSLRGVSLRSIFKLHRAETRARLWAVLRWLTRRARARIKASFSDGPPEAPLSVRADAALERLRRSGKPVLMLFAARESLDLELTELGRMQDIEAWPNIEVQRLAVASHTLRPHWARQQAYAIMDRALERQLRSADSQQERV